MVNTENFDIMNFDVFTGLLYGIIAQDFDVTHIFIDSLFKSVPKEKVEDVDGFLDILESLDKKFNVSFTVMISVSEDEATEKMKKYID